MDSEAPQKEAKNHRMESYSHSISNLDRRKQILQINECQILSNQHDDILSPQYYEAEKEIKDVYDELVNILNTTADYPADKSQLMLTMVESDPSMAYILNRPRATKSATTRFLPVTEINGFRPFSAPDMSSKQQLNALPSDSIKRAVSARKSLIAAGKMPNINLDDFESRVVHSKEFDGKLLKRLNPIKKEPIPPGIFKNMDEIIVPEISTNKQISWRVPSRPQTAILNAHPKTKLTRPYSAMENSNLIIKGKITRPSSSSAVNTFQRPTSAAKYLQPSSRPVSTRRLRSKRIIEDFFDEFEEEDKEFDDEENETRTGTEWVELGPMRGEKYTLAFSRFFTYPEQASLLDWEWLPCDVLEYDVKKRNYLVKWHSNQQGKYVKRLNLIFADEDRVLFYKRLERAIKRRNTAELKKSYYETIKSTVSEAKIGGIPEFLQNGVFNRLSKNISDTQMSIINNCYEEMQQDYMISIQKSVFENDEDGWDDLDDASPASVKFAKLALDKSGIEKTDNVYPEMLNQVANGTKELSTCLFTANAHFQKTIISILGTLSKTIQKSDRFFQKKLQYPLEFSLFCEKQKVHCELVQARLCNEWPRAVAKIENLNEIFKFDEQTNLKAYKNSRCNDFLQLVSLIMETHLRDLVVEGMIQMLKIFKIIVEKADKKHKHDIKSSQLYSAKTISSEKREYLVSSPKDIHIPLLFRVSILCDEQGIVVSNPSMKQIVDPLKLLYSLPRILTLNSIASMEVMLMTRIFTNPQEYRYINTMEKDHMLFYDGEMAIISMVKSKFPQVDKIVNLYSQFTGLVNHPINIDEMDDLEADISIFEGPLNSFNNTLDKITDINSMWDLMGKYLVPMNDVMSSLYWKAYSWPPKIVVELSRSKIRLEESKLQIRSQINVDRNHCLMSIAAYEEEILIFEKISSLNNCSIINNQTHNLRQRINKVFDLMDEINVRGQLIGEELFVINHSLTLIASFENFEKLWSTADEMIKTIEKWMGTFFMELNAEEMIEKMENWRTHFSKLEHVFLENSNPSVVLRQLRANLDTFARYTNILISLLNPALRDKHWNQISNIIGISLQDVQGLCLKEVMELDLELVQDIVGDISKDASSDLKLEANLESMKSELSNNEFTLTEFSQEVNYLSNIAEAVSLFEDHLIRCGNISLEARSSNLIVRINTWIKRLFRGQEALDLFPTFQTMFAKLFPLFQSQFFVEGLNKEDFDDFSSISKTMIMISDIITKNRKFIIVILRSDIYDLLSGACVRAERLLYSTQKIVSKIQLLFPRFYFLPPLDILKILGSSADLNTLNTFLPKLFDNVSCLVTQTREDQTWNENSSISFSSGLKSKTGEVIQPRRLRRRSSRFSGEAKEQKKEAKELDIATKQTSVTSIFGFESIDSEFILLANKIPLSDRIDQILINFEKNLKSTLWSLLTNVLAKPSSHDITTLLGNMPLQVIYITASLTWTKNIGDFVIDQKDSFSKDIRKNTLKNIDSLVRFLKNCFKSSLRNSAECLIMLYQSFLNTIDSLISNDGLPTSRVDFNDTLRYYVEENKLLVKMQYYSINYDWEYAGTSPRLFINLFGNRSLSTIMSTMLQNENCSILGNDSRFKRDAIKEIATSFGKRLVNVTCISNLDMKYLTSVFCGMISVGAFVNLENITQLDRSSLALVAAQIQTIQKGRLMVTRSIQTTFQFDHKDFSNQTFSSVFLSVGADNWERLPKRFKTIFRPIGLNLPDTNVIAETVLQSKGFNMSMKLSTRCRSLIKMVSPILHKIEGVKFSYSLLKTILSVSSTEQTKNSNSTSEVKAVLESFHTNLVSQVYPKDQKYVELLIHDIIGGTFSQNLDSQSTIQMKIDISQTMEKMGLMPTPIFVSNTYDTFKLLSSSMPVLVLGAPLNGKTTMINVLVDTMNQHAKSKLKGYSNHNPPFKNFRIFPDAVSHTRLFDSPDSAKNEGFLSSVFKTATIHADHWGENKELTESEKMSIISIDGECDEIDVDRILRSVEYGNLMILPSGECTISPKSLKLLFEKSTISSWSPFSISKCRIIHIPTENLLPFDILKREFQSFPAAIRKYPKLIESIHELLFTSINENCLQNFHSNLPSSPNSDIIRISKMFKAIFNELTDEGYARLMDFEKICWVTATFIFCMIWVLGAIVEKGERLSFSLFLKRTISNGFTSKLESSAGLKPETLSSCVMLPAEGTVYDFYFDSKLLAWKPWSHMHINQRKVSDASLIVTTNDLIRVPYLINIMANQNTPVLIFGKSGCGKTTCCTRIFENKKFEENPVILNINSSSRKMDFQEKVEKRLSQKRLNTLGPVSGKSILAFVDDLNPPSFEIFSQMWETWRVWCEIGGWYINDKYTKIENVQLVVSMTSTGFNIKNKLKSLRSFRHFIGIPISDSDEGRVREIMGSWKNVLLSAIGKGCESFCASILNLSLDVYHQSLLNFKSSPINPHLKFSMADILNTLRPLIGLSFNSVLFNELMQLWYHDTTRIYGDKLTNQKDQILFQTILEESIKKHFKINLGEIIDPSDQPVLSQSFGKELSLQTSFIDSTPMPNGILKSFKKNMNTFRQSYFSDKDTHLSYIQMNSVGNYGGQLISAKIHHGIKTTGCSIIVGENHGDRAIICRLMCTSSSIPFIELKWADDVYDKSTQWKEFLNSIFTKAIESWKPIAIYIHFEEIKHSFQWDDIIAIIKWGWIHNSNEDVIRTSFITDTIKKKLENFGWNLNKDPISKLSELFTKARFVKIIISIESNDRSNWWKIYNSYPSLQSASIVWIDKLDLETVKYGALNMKTKCVKCDWLNSFLEFAFSPPVLDGMINDEFQYSGRTCKIKPFYSKNVFSIYSILFERKEAELSLQMDKLCKTLAATDKVFGYISKLEEDFRNWDAKLKASIDLTQKCLSIMENEVEAKHKISIDLQVEDDLLKKLNQDIIVCESQYAEEVEKALPALGLANKACDSLKKNDIYEIKSMINPPRSMLLVMEALCLLFKIEVKQNEIIWDVAKRLLSETKFVHSIINFDKDTLNATMMYKVSIVTAHVDFDLKELHGVSKAIGSLGSWIVALQKYHSSLSIFEPTKKKIRDLKAKIVALKHSKEVKLDQKIGIEKSLIKIRTEFDTQISYKESITRTFKDLERKLAKAKEIHEILSAGKIRWLTSLDKIRGKMEMIEADCVLYSCYSAYLGPFSKQIRQKSLKTWKDWMTQQSINFSNIEYFCEFCLSPADIFLFNDIAPDYYNLDNILISRFNKIYSLICDPQENINQLIQIYEKEFHPISISTNDASWQDTLVSLFKGAVPVILNMNMAEPDSFLLQLFKDREWSEFHHQPLFSFTFKDQIIEMNENFRLYIVSNMPINHVNESILENVICIKCDYDFEVLNSILNDQALLICGSGLKEQKRHIDVDTINRTNRLSGLENRSMEFIQSFLEDDIYGGENFKTLIENEEQLTVTIAMLQTPTKGEKDLLIQLQFYKAISNFASKIFKILEKLAKPKIYHVSFNFFVSIFKRTLSDLEGEKSKSLFYKNFLQNVHNFYSSGYLQSDQTYLSFQFAVEYQNILEGEQVDPDLVLLDHHWFFFLNGEIHPSVKLPKKWHVDEFPQNPSHQYIKKKSWERILTLSKLSEFSKFAMEFVRYANKATTPPTEACWEDLYRSLDPSTCKLPSRWENQLTKFERLLVIQCIRPDSITKCFQDYIRSSIGDSYLDQNYDLFSPTISSFRYLSNSITPIMIIPTLILSHQSEDILIDLKRMAVTKHMTNFLTLLNVEQASLALTSNTWSVLEEQQKVLDVIDDAALKGRWVIVQNCNQIPEFMSAIDLKLRGLEKEIMFGKSLIHPNFRLWFISQMKETSIKTMPISIYGNSRRMLIDTRYQGFTVQIERMYYLIEENLNPHEFNSNASYRSLLIKIFLFHLTLIRRNLFLPYSGLFPREYTQQDLIVAIKQLRMYFKEYVSTQTDKDLSKRWFQLFGESYASISTEMLERRLIQTLFQDILQSNWGNQAELNYLQDNFKKVLDLLNRNEGKNGEQLLKNLKESLLDPEYFYLCQNSIVSIEKFKSVKLFEICLHLNHEIVINHASADTWNIENIRLLRDQAVSILEVQLASVYNNTILDLDTAFSEDAFLESQSRTKHMDTVLCDNVLGYREILKEIKRSLLNFKNGIDGKIEYDDEMVMIARDFILNRVPAIWKTRCCSMYKSEMNLKKWLSNFCNRLTFINEWFMARYGVVSVNIHRGLISYDISMMINPQSFFNAMILDYAISARENVESIEFDVMILPIKQLTLPDRGYYISGVNMYGATWDFAHNVIKESKSHDLLFSLNCVWIQPVLRHVKDPNNLTAGGQGGSSTNQGAKQQANGNVKRSWQKYSCPLVLYRPSVEKDFVFNSMVCGNDGERDRVDCFSGNSGDCLWITDISLSSDVVSKVWVKRNVYLTLY